MSFPRNVYTSRKDICTRQLIAGVGEHNLALMKSTQQSTTANRTYSSSRAVDGNKKSGHCAQTSGTDVPWWQVELQAMYVIKQVKITGGCPGKLYNYIYIYIYIYIPQTVSAI